MRGKGVGPVEIPDLWIKLQALGRAGIYWVIRMHEEGLSYFSH